jgi:hypothetical protein
MPDFSASQQGYKRDILLYAFCLLHTLSPTVTVTSPATATLANTCPSPLAIHNSGGPPSGHVRAKPD